MLVLKLETRGRQTFAGIANLADTSKLADCASQQVHDVIVEHVKAVFEAEGIPTWAPLSWYTLIQRQLLGFGPGPILQRTGDLLRSLTDNAHPSHVWRLELGARRSVIIVGTSLEKAWSLGFGADNLPARPMFPPAQVIHPELAGAIVDAGIAIV